MIPIDPGEEFGRLAVLGADQPEYIPLPARQSPDEMEMMTLWEFSDEERAAIAAGGNLGLRVVTFGDSFSPISLAVEGTPGWANFHE